MNLIQIKPEDQLSTHLIVTEFEIGHGKIDLLLALRNSTSQTFAGATLTMHKREKISAVRVRDNDCGLIKQPILVLQYSRRKCMRIYIAPSNAQIVEEEAWWLVSPHSQQST